jgi:hypothetical protein
MLQNVCVRINNYILDKILSILLQSYVLFENILLPVRRTSLGSKENAA